MKTSWLEIQVELLEDLHAGTGLGMAGVDALVQRDRHGLPMISRTHFEGLLRAAASDLGLNPDTTVQLFGHPGGPRQRAIFTSLRMNQSSADVQTRIWYATARTAFDNRAPLDDTLRITEYIPAGTVLRGKVFLPEELVEPLETLLRRCAQLGAGRRRGDGLVRFAINSVPPPQGRELPSRAGLRLRLRLRAVEPWCLARTGQPSNIIPTERFLRGQALQGALIDWLLTWGGGPSVAGVIDWEAISVGDALPLPPAIEADNLESIEVLPVPLSLGRPKPEGSRGPLPWWAENPSPPPSQDGLKLADGNEAKSHGSPGAAKLKRPADGEHIARSDSRGWYRYSPHVSVHLRNSQRPGPGRPPELFAQEEITEDTCFVTDIQFESGEVADAFVQALCEVLTGRAWLTVGRGKAPAVVEEAVWIDRAREIHPIDSIRPPFRLTLTSDLLVLDDWLCWETRLTEERLKQLAGVRMDLEITLEGVQEPTEIRGFNAASGLPRAPVYGIKRGSSYRIGGAGAVKVLRSLAIRKALGQGTHLGFGRFRLDPDDMPPGLPELPLGVVYRTPAPIEEQNERMLERARGLAERVPLPPEGPSRSQWWALRDAIRSCSSLQDVHNYIDSLGRTQAGRVWGNEQVKRVLNEFKKCGSVDEIALLVDATIRWVFPKARRLEHERL